MGKAGVKSFLQQSTCSIYMKAEGGETYSDLTKPLRETEKDLVLKGAYGQSHSGVRVW